MPNIGLGEESVPNKNGKRLLELINSSNLSVGNIGREFVRADGLGKVEGRDQWWIMFCFQEV